MSRSGGEPHFSERTEGLQETRESDRGGADARVGQWDRWAAILTWLGTSRPGAREGLGGWGLGWGSTPWVTGHLLVQGEPWGSVLARKYPMRH